MARYQLADYASEDEKQVGGLVQKVEYKMVPNAVNIQKNILLNKYEHFMMSELFLPTTSVVPVQQLVRYVYVCVLDSNF